MRRTVTGSTTLSNGPSPASPASEVARHIAALEQALTGVLRAALPALIGLLRGIRGHRVYQPCQQGE